MRACSLADGPALTPAARWPISGRSDGWYTDRLEGGAYRIGLYARALGSIEPLDAWADRAYVLTTR